MKHASVDKAKRVDSGCRNNGSCPHCRRSRTMAAARVAAKSKLEEAQGFGDAVAGGIIARQDARITTWRGARRG